MFLGDIWEEKHDTWLRLLLPGYVHFIIKRFLDSNFTLDKVK